MANYFETEVDRVANDPTYSVADVKHAESWALNGQRDWERRTKESAAKRSSALTEKQSEAYDRIRTIQKAIDADRTALDNGQMSAVDFMQNRRRYLAQIGELERLVSGFHATEASISDMLADPVGWLDALYTKWPTLQHQRPRVDDWIEQRRARRLSR